MEIMAAPGTVNILLSRAPGQPQQRPALRAPEIFVLLHAFQASEELFGLQDSALEKEHEFPVLLLPLNSVFREKPEKKQAVQSIADVNQPEKPGQRNGNLDHEAGKQQRQTELVRSVPDGHKPGKPEKQLSEKIHQTSLFQMEAPGSPRLICLKYIIRAPLLQEGSVFARGIFYYLLLRSFPDWR